MCEAFKGGLLLPPYPRLPIAAERPEPASYQLLHTIIEASTDTVSTGAGLTLANEQNLFTSTTCRLSPGHRYEFIGADGPGKTKSLRISAGNSGKKV